MLSEEPVSIVGLIKLGGQTYSHSPGIVFFGHILFEFFTGDLFSVIGDELAGTHPRNMKEARELLVRCGAIKEETNEN